VLKKLLKPLTLLGLILLFAGLFFVLFGSDNVTIGISTVLVVLMYLTRDLTANPVKNTVKLVLFNVTMGLVAFAASLNLYLAIPLNFICLFTIAAALSYTISSPIATPFTMQYLFLLVTPVSLAGLPLRLAALATGALFIMAIQWRVNRQRVARQREKIVPAILSELVRKAAGLSRGADVSLPDQAVRAALSQLKRSLYDARRDHYFFTRENALTLELVNALDRLNALLPELATLPQRETVFNDLVRVLTPCPTAGDMAGEQATAEPLTAAAFCRKYEAAPDAPLCVLQVCRQLAILNTAQDAIVALTADQGTPAAASPRPPQDRSLNRTRARVSLNALSLSYAFRLAFAITSCAFLVGFFHLEHGNWLLFTVSSLTYPFYELSRQKTGLRLVGTCIGGVLVVLLFSVLQLQQAVALVMIVSLFLTMVYMNQYVYTMIFSTITAISSLVLIDNAASLSLERVGYVLIGGLAVLLLSRFVLPYTEKDAATDLLKLYDDILLTFFQDLGRAASYTADFNSRIMNLLLTTTLIEDKLMAADNAGTAAELQDFIATRHQLLITIDQAYRWLEQNRDNLESFKVLMLYLQHHADAIEKTPDEALLAAISRDCPPLDRVVVGDSLANFRALRQLQLLA
jgi:uncharacterized membrane protein YccC